MSYGPWWPPERLSPVVGCDAEWNQLVVVGMPDVKFNLLWVTLRWGTHPLDINPSRPNLRPTRVPYSFS